MFTLKPISVDAIPAALAKAERYRLLNEPEQAESICEDVLAVQPSHHQALIMLILALTEQFKHHETGIVGRVQELVGRLESEYERAYYTGILAERRTRAFLTREGPGAALPAADWLRAAMESFERADELRPAGNDDARLRWNACARMADRHPHLLASEEQERGQPLMLE
jgi:hypothetical protein